jgi:hypothetical protein
MPVCHIFSPRKCPSTGDYIKFASPVNGNLLMGYISLVEKGIAGKKKRRREQGEKKKSNY